MARPGSGAASFMAIACADAPCSLSTSRRAHGCLSELRKPLRIPALQQFGNTFTQRCWERRKINKFKKLVHLLQGNPPSERGLLFWPVGELVLLEAQPLFSRRIDHPQSSNGLLSLWKLLFMVWCVETINMGASVWSWGWGRHERGFPALCETWKWGGSFSRPILGAFLPARKKCQMRPDTLVYCVKKGKRSLNYLQINCLLPLSVPRGPIRECVSKSWESASHFTHARGSLPTDPLPDTRPKSSVAAISHDKLECFN